MRPYPRKLMILAVVAHMVIAGCSSTRQSTWTLLQESAYGDKFLYDPNSVEQTAAGTVLVWAGTDSVKYHYEIDCTKKKARILESAHIDPTWFSIKAQSGDELVYNAVCRTQ